MYVARSFLPKNSAILPHMGLGFQAAKYPSPPWDFDLFHISRANRCRFRGTSLDKGVSFHHVTSVSIRERESATPDASGRPVQNPVLSQGPPIQNPSTQHAPVRVEVPVGEKNAGPCPSPRCVCFGRKLFYLSSFTTFIGIFTRVATLAQAMDLAKRLETIPGACFTNFATWTIGVVIRPESAITKGLVNVRWENHHWVAPWVLRMLFLVIFFGREGILPHATDPVFAEI